MGINNRFHCNCLFNLDAERHDVVLVPTATVGINSVVQSVVRTLKPGAAILMLNLAYGNDTVALT